MRKVTAEVEISEDSDGPWLSITSPSGVCASVSLARISKGALIQAAFVEWATAKLNNEVPPCEA